MSKYTEGWFAGGLHRYGTDGTSGNRCAAVMGTSFRCGICGNQAPAVEVETERGGGAGGGHPRWYYVDRKVTGPIFCGKPDYIQHRTACVWLWHLSPIPVVILALLLWFA